MKEGLTSRPLYGKYRGTVTQVDAATMRIKAKVTALDNVESGWAMPCVPYAGKSVGFAFLPEKDSAVWIEFEQGDVSFPVWARAYSGGSSTPKLNRCRFLTAEARYG